jgi:riboflavin synthase
VFTGLIKEIAEVISFTNNILTLKAKYRPNIGDSIAINGACFTTVSINNNTFSVELSPESQKTITIDNYKNNVHIEPAMKIGDRFEGHIVQGHVDCIGTIDKIVKNGNSTDFFIELPKEFIKFVISKGSITIDGISLTINDVEIKKNKFKLTIIPYTIANTLFKSYKVKGLVNIETDMFARYIYNLFKNNENLSWGEVDKIMVKY